MKELSIEEKAYDGNYKAYTELINRLEDVKNAIKKQNYGIAMDVLCKPYPEFQVITHSELKESEDEKIRESLLEYLHTLPNHYSHSGVCAPEWIAWLEKQGKCEIDYTQNHQDSTCPNGCIVLEDFNDGEGFYKVHLDYLNKKQVEEVEEMIRVWNKELKTPNENIKDCIGMCLTDVDEQRFKDYNTNLKDCLVWLEKQGEQKSVKFKPLFKVGDVIKPKDPALGEPRIIKGIYPKFGYDTNNGILDFEFEDNWELAEEPVSRTPADIEAAMQEVEEKSRAFTEAHKRENADDILAQMRGEEPVSIWHDASKKYPLTGKEIIVLRDDKIYYGKYIGGLHRYVRDEIQLTDDTAQTYAIIDNLTKKDKWIYVEDLLNLSNVERTVKDWKEPVSEELEEASKEWLIPQLDKSYANYGEVKMMELTHFDGYAMLDAIEFGAKWQEAKDQEIIETAIHHAYHNGRLEMKEKMMAKAIDGKVIANGMGNPILHLWDKGRHLIGKKVKVIVIKED